MKGKFMDRKVVNGSRKYDKDEKFPTGSGKVEKKTHMKWESDEEEDTGDDTAEDDYSGSDDRENADDYYGSDPEEFGNAYDSAAGSGNSEEEGDDYSDDEDDDDDSESLPPRPHPGPVTSKAAIAKKPIGEVSLPSNVPLYKLLAKQQKSIPSDDHPDSHRRPKKIKRSREDANLRGDEEKKKKNKRAPTEMRSDRPVRRLRVDADNSVRKSIDPRFVDYTGELNQKIYAKNYSFLEDYREKEIQQLSVALKRAKGTGREDEIKHELLVLKQQLSQRQQALRTMDKIDSLEKEEREKVKAGVKNPFYLKKSAKKQILLEERFKDLKKTGKLGKYMERKQKKQHRQQTKYMPDRRDF
eukprot:gene38796-47181_t